MKHKILIVDDRPENLYSLESMLSEDDRIILKANSGEEALKIAFNEDLSLIMLDVQMPEMDGFEVANMLKSTNRTKKTPIIFVTAISKEKKYMIQGLEEGAMDYLFKPLDTNVTRAKVETLLKFYAQQKELELKNTELAKLNEEKNYFLGVASHDLRNPLGNIITLASFVKNNNNANLDEENKNYIDVIISTGRQMLELLESLLDVTKIESGTMNLHLKHVHISDVIQESINENKISADRKGISFEFSISEIIPMNTFDPLQIQQVLNNLISNAIKYSHNNTNIEINTTLQNSKIIVTVKDQGQGIPKHEQSGVFVPFNKTSVKGTNGEKGTGLGLTIAKKVIESHGGEIWLRSEVGIGSSFCFSLPLQAMNEFEKLNILQAN
jgi:two-component system sensor histidine kinase/response regulator